MNKKETKSVQRTSRKVFQTYQKVFQTILKKKISLILQNMTLHKILLFFLK